MPSSTAAANKKLDSTNRKEYPVTDQPTRKQLANAIRALSMDAVEQARSGHPGMPMGMADIAEVLWNDFLNHNPSNPRWHDRDRFVLSNGHGSMLLYSLAYLTGYPLEIEELQQFRQFGQRTAGHPERDLDIGIETTTGPLGQGLANAVGMALAEKVLAEDFNRPDIKIVDHHTYVFLGDGCLMEGISHEACSLAGTLKLGKLIALYDDNGITIDGETAGWFTDDTASRFRSYGWDVIDNVDGHDALSISSALKNAQSETQRPTLIICKTVIGFGAPNKQGTADTHGAPLGTDEIEAARSELEWNHPPFSVPDNILKEWDKRSKGAALETKWQKRFDAYKSTYPELAEEYLRRMEGRLPLDWRNQSATAISKVIEEAKDVATRKASLRALEAYAPFLPELMGGSADLTGSNLTLHSRSTAINKTNSNGNYIYFGVREFGMTAILNGMSLHGGFIPYGGTFLVFSDYARNALRMAALMRIQNISVLTHDSIGLGEDGPTHQPVEHIASLRAIPNMNVWRPCDGVETAVAWRSAIERKDGPTSLILTRQGLPHIDRTANQIETISCGGYTLLESDGDPELVIIATGSEVNLALLSAQELVSDGIRVRVVSMPCTEIFDIQSVDYRSQILPDTNARRLVIEAGIKDSWWRYVDGKGDVIGMDTFGHSAPASLLFEHYGFTVKAIVSRARQMLTV